MRIYLESETYLMVVVAGNPRSSPPLEKGEIGKANEQNEGVLL